MASFEYVARTRSGEKVQGSVDAPDRRSALAKLAQQGHIPVSVKEAGAAAAKKDAQIVASRGPTRMKTRDVLTFTTELSDLLSAGMQLGQALTVLANRKTGKASDKVIADLREEIMQGSSLSEAVAKQPRSFPTLYSSLIRAGEAGGALPEVLRRLVLHYQRMQAVKEKVTMALVYPMFIMGMGALIIIFLMTQVIPKFEKIFTELGSNMPLSTRILINMSRGTVKYGWVGLILMGAVGYAFWQFNRTPHGKLWFHSLQLRLPLVNRIIKANCFAQFARTLSTLLNNGVHVLEALGIVQKTITNAVVAREIATARDRVTDGTSISGPLAAGKIFPQLMTDMLSVGEKTGNISNALEHIAERYENELDRNVKIFTTVLEPVFLLLIALMVGFVAMSIFVAVQEMTNGLGA
jgi:type II secretory pathway component PulF